MSMSCVRLSKAALMGALACAGSLAAVAQGGGATNSLPALQAREELFAFAKKPSVTSIGSGRYQIVFETTANCDATVAILDKNGKVIRHLASGVLGPNAPWPFQPTRNLPAPFRGAMQAGASRSDAGGQDSLTQKIEWDGTDDQGVRCEVVGGRPENSSSSLPPSTFHPPPFSVRVSLGLQAKYERDIAWEPLKITYIEKDGKYFRTLYPPPADAPEDKLKAAGLRPATDVWGGRIFLGNSGGPFEMPNTYYPGRSPTCSNTVAILKPLYEGKAPPRTVEFPTNALPPQPGEDGGGAGRYVAYTPRLTVAPDSDELYVGGGLIVYRFDGKTGKFDDTWFPKGDFNFVGEMDVGPDGLIYMRVSKSGYGHWLIRVDRTGKPVDFPNGVLIPAGDREVPNALVKQAIKGVFCGTVGWCQMHQKGFDVAPNGRIVSVISELNAKWAVAQGLIKDEKEAQNTSLFFVNVWDATGKLVSANAVPGLWQGHGVFMDREGSIYLQQNYLRRLEAKPLYGIPESMMKAVTLEWGIWGCPGSLIKFRGKGDVFPVGQVFSGKAWTNAPAEAIELKAYNNPTEQAAVVGAQWIYDSIYNQGRGGCSCGHTRNAMDAWGRLWISANGISAVVVLDANGNHIARFGQYGNVDDEGIRFAWVRALAASDRAFYASDYSNKRILKAALSYAAEESVEIK